MKLGVAEMELIESALEWEAGRLERIASSYDDPKPLLERALKLRKLHRRFSVPLDVVRDKRSESKLILELSKVRARIKQRRAK